jgi:hypothetical protein
MQTINIFPKVYETAKLTMFYVFFFNQKTSIYVNSVNVLWVAFSIPSRHSVVSRILGHPVCITQNLQSKWG